MGGLEGRTLALGYIQEVFVAFVISTNDDMSV